MPWTTFLSLSTIWIAWRVYLVFQKPVDDLEEVLGIDVPPIPEISLSSISKDAVLLYWKPPDTYHSPLRQCIQINGNNIEEFEHSDGSVQLTGLQPGSCYGIRAIATNNAGNSTYSRLIQIQTVPEEGNERVKQLAEVEQHLIKKTSGSRRVSQPLPNIDASSLPAEADAAGDVLGQGDGSIANLNSILDGLRQSKEEIEVDLRRDIEESESQKLGLVENRDSIKQKLDEQEKDFQEKRKQVNDLEKQLKSLQRRKQAKDKTLQQKKTERQKMRDEVERWMEESVDMEEKMDSLKTQKVALEETNAEKLKQAQEKIQATIEEVKALEEEIRDLGIKVNEQRKTAKVMQDEEDKESERREQQHELRMSQLHADIRAVYAEHYQCEDDHRRAQEYRQFLAEDRLKNPARYSMLSGVEYPNQFGMAKRNRPGSRMGNGSGFSSSRPYTSGFNSTGNPFPNGLLGLNTRPSNLGPITSVRLQEIDALTGGALVSPSANQLLPKDLLGDEDFAIDSPRGDYPAIDTITQRQGSWDQDPQSPHTPHSTSHSAMNSPHESYTSIPQYYTMDGDNQSMHSANSPYHQDSADASGSRRRASLFGFGRQRPKSSVNELPPLGSLTSSQSQSFPLNDPEPTGRKRTGYSAWMFNRGNTSIDDESGPSLLPRKTKRGLFGPKLDPSEAFNQFDRSGSPRPPSTSSHDIGLPRPSSESIPFGWNYPDGLRQRASPLNADWSAAPGQSAWSRNQSRRPSLQYGSTSNLSLGSIPIEIDEFGNPYKVSQPAPIGTERFNIKAKQKAPPKLNPAAPSFTARLFTKKEKNVDEAETSEPSKPKSKAKGKSKDKNRDKGKAKEKEKEKKSDIKHVHSAEFEVGVWSEDGSTSRSHVSPRVSRDSYWNSQDDESQSSVLELTTSHTDSQMLSTPTSLHPAKESLMQKITRKSSSSKFSAAWKERSIFTSKKGTGEPGTPIDMDEDTAGDYLSRSMLSDTGTAPGTPVTAGRLSSSWGRVMSMTGKAKAKSSTDKDEKDRSSVEIEDSHDE